jgi:hypothetical protein
MKQIVLSLLIVGLVPGVLAIAAEPIDEKPVATVAFRPSSGMLSSMTLAESRAVQSSALRRSAVLQPPAPDPVMILACRKNPSCDERMFRLEPTYPAYLLDTRRSKRAGRSGTAELDLGFVPSEIETPDFALNPDSFLPPIGISVAAGSVACD